MSSSGEPVKGTQLTRYFLNQLRPLGGDIVDHITELAVPPQFDFRSFVISVANPADGSKIWIHVEGRGWNSAWDVYSRFLQLNSGGYIRRNAATDIGKKDSLFLSLRQARLMGLKAYADIILPFAALLSAPGHIVDITPLRTTYENCFRPLTPGEYKNAEGKTVYRSGMTTQGADRFDFVRAFMYYVNQMSARSGPLQEHCRKVMRVWNSDNLDKALCKIMRPDLCVMPADGFFIKCAWDIQPHGITTGVFRISVPDAFLNTHPGVFFEFSNHTLTVSLQRTPQDAYRTVICALGNVEFVVDERRHEPRQRLYLPLAELSAVDVPRAHTITVENYRSSPQGQRVSIQLLLFEPLLSFQELKESYSQAPTSKIVIQGTSLVFDRDPTRCLVQFKKDTTHCSWTGTPLKDENLNADYYEKYTKWDQKFCKLVQAALLRYCNAMLGVETFADIYEVGYNVENFLSIPADPSFSRRWRTMTAEDSAFKIYNTLQGRAPNFGAAKVKQWQTLQNTWQNQDQIKRALLVLSQESLPSFFSKCKWIIPNRDSSHNQHLVAQFKINGIPHLANHRGIGIELNDNKLRVWCDEHVVGECKNVQLHVNFESIQPTEAPQPKRYHAPLVLSTESRSSSSSQSSANDSRRRRIARRY